MSTTVEKDAPSSRDPVLSRLRHHDKVTAKVVSHGGSSGCAMKNRTRGSWRAYKAVQGARVCLRVAWLVSLHMIVWTFYGIPHTDGGLDMTAQMQMDYPRKCMLLQPLYRTVMCAERSIVGTRSFSIIRCQRRMGFGSAEPFIDIHSPAGPPPGVDSKPAVPAEASHGNPHCTPADGTCSGSVAFVDICDG